MKIIKKMKLFAMLLVMLPLTTLADVCSPPHYYRTQRVGYEILPDIKALPSECLSKYGLMIAIVLALIGVLVYVCMRRTRAFLCFLRALLRFLKFVFVLVVRTFHTLSILVFLVLCLVILNQFLSDRVDFAFLVILFILLLLSLVPIWLRRKIKSHFPFLFGRGPWIASWFGAGVVLVIFLISWLDLYYEQSYYVPDYDPAPEWECPTGTEVDRETVVLLLKQLQQDKINPYFATSWDVKSAIKKLNQTYQKKCLSIPFDLLFRAVRHPYEPAYRRWPGPPESPREAISKSVSKGVEDGMEIMK